MRAATTALLDQAAAAAAHAEAILRAAAGASGDRVTHCHPGPVFTAIIRRLHTRALAGQVTLCPHLTHAAPEPAFWCAWAPGRLRCAACAHQANIRVRGTAEDRRCDHCRKIHRSIHPDMAQLPPIVVDLPPWPPKCVPPVTVMFGLCPACQATDIQNRPED